jgi:hypothetical protein
MSEIVGGAARVRSGKCLCKRHRFTVSGTPHDGHICPCRHCQRRSGAPLQWWVSFPTTTLVWVSGGDLTWYDTYAGKTKRGFCGTCGSHLLSVDYGDDELVGVLVVALDEPNDPLLFPDAHNLRHLREAAPWLGALLDAQAGGPQEIHECGRADLDVESAASSAP